MNGSWRSAIGLWWARLSSAPVPPVAGCADAYVLATGTVYAYTLAPYTCAAYVLRLGTCDAYALECDT